MITGSSRGIGKSIALELAGHGYCIVLHGRTMSTQLETTRQQIEAVGGQVRQLVFDVSDRDASKTALEQDILQFGCYYGIILNAGIVRDSAFPFMTEADWDDVLSTNLDSFFNVLKPLIEPLILAKQGGRIIVMSSVSGLLGNRGQVNYSAAKAGLMGAVKALGLELAKKKITVNCVAPGFIETDMTAPINQNQLQNQILPQIPMRRAGLVSEVSGVVTFLLSPQAAYITRQTIAIDGGLSCGG